jgi:hypothetical protein
LKQNQSQESKAIEKAEQESHRNFGEINFLMSEQN